MELYEVSKKVNNPQTDNEELINPLIK